MDGLSRRQDYERVARSLSAPLMAAIVEAAGPPEVDAAMLREMGYRVVLFPVSALFAVARTLTRLMAEIRARGTTSAVIEELMDYHSFVELMGLQRYARLDEDYG